MARFPASPVAPLTAALSLALLAAGCAESPRPDQVITAIDAACEICGAEGEPHVDREAVREWMRATGVAQAAGETTSGPFDHGELPEPPRLCPKGFGGWERDAFARVLPPVRFADEPDHVGWVWAIVGREPLMHMGGGAFVSWFGPNDVEHRDGGRGFVRLLALSVRGQEQERGTVVLVSRYFPNGHVGICELAPEGAALAEIVAVDRCESLVGLPGEVVLASVDGNALRLRFAESFGAADAEEPELRSPWLERIEARVYDPDDEMVIFETSD